MPSIENNSLEFHSCNAEVEGVSFSTWICWWKILYPRATHGLQPTVLHDYRHLLTHTPCLMHVNDYLAWK